MSAFYDRLNATAQRLLATYGKAGAILRETRSGPAHAPTVTTAQYPCTFVETRYRLTNRDAALIQVGDKVGVISTDLSIVPALADKIEIESRVYKFVDLMPLNPGGTTLLYSFIARA